MKNFKTYFLIVIFFSIIAIVTYCLMETLIEPRVTNFCTKFFTHKKANDNVVMIMIDQKSLNKIRWPWKRKLYAQIIEYVNDYGQASVIAHDSLIHSPDIDYPESDEYFFNTIEKYSNYITAFDAGIDVSAQNALNTSALNILNKKSVLNITNDKKLPKSPFNSILNLYLKQIESAQNFGSVITPIDNDGYIRNALPVVRINDKYYPMLAFAAAAKHKGVNEFEVKDNILCAKGDCNKMNIRVTNTNYGLLMKINWYKPIDEFSTHKTYSAIDIIESNDAIKSNAEPVIPPEVFKNKIVIIGAAAKVKSLEDIKSTPIIEKTHAGADIQATVISNILENNSKYEITITQKKVIALLSVLFSVWLVASFGLSVSLITTGILILSYIITALTLFVKGIIIQIITPPLLILLVIFAGFTFRFLIEGKKKEQIQNAMGLYISKDIMKNVVKNIDNLQLGGKRANISVLFADIRGFTSISEKLSAEEVTEILNEYFSAVEPIIRKHNGVLNKFIGDAVLAIFGEPIQDKNHTINAVLCANEMHEKIIKLQKKWDLEGKPHIEIGVAINTGEAFVGNIGSPERIEYTVIGDTVNTASRIESYNKVYKTRFLISESTYEKVSRFCDVIKIREVAIRGKSKKINIYEVLKVTKPDDNQ